MHFIAKHLKSNRGDGYIWFIIALIVALTFFGALYDMLQTNIAMKNIKAEIDQTAEDVFADVRQESYEYLTAGATNHSYTQRTANQIAQMFALKLGADVSWTPGFPVITRDGVGERQFSITNLQYLFIDRMQDRNADRFAVGDLSHDDYINSEDLVLLLAYLDDNTIPIIFDDYDINSDGAVDINDVPILRALIDYYARFNGSVKSETSTALLLISMDVSVPIRFGMMNFGSSTNTYFYTTTLTVKQA